MNTDNPFSFASVILSYFLVGGGMFAATLIGGRLQLGTAGGYALLAVGAAAGGFIAARASRGRTLLEPMIGAVAVVATIVAVAATTPLGQLIWAMAEHQTVRAIAVVAGIGVVGALLGAFFGERLFGEETRSSVPWLLYTALSVFGACLLATLVGAIAVLGRVEGGDASTSPDYLGRAILIGIAAGCLLAGLAVGASARVRPLIAALVGSAIGVAGFCALVTRGNPPEDSAVAGLALLAGAGAIVTMFGTAVGWTAFGRRGLA